MFRGSFRIHAPFRRLGPFQHQVGSFLFHRNQKPTVDPTAPVLQLRGCSFHRYAGYFQTAQTVPGDPWIRIFCSVHHPPNSSRHQGVRAGWGFAVVCAGFQRNVGRGLRQEQSVFWGKGGQGGSLRMQIPRAPVETLCQPRRAGTTNAKHAPFGKRGCRIDGA